MKINRRLLIFAVAATILVTFRGGLLFSSATPYVQTTQSAVIEQTTARLHTIDVSFQRNIFVAINDNEFWRDAAFSPSDTTMFGLNTGYVDALVKADSVRFNLSSLKGGRGASLHKGNIGPLANSRDWFEARWNFEPVATLAQVHAIVGTFSNLGAAESFNFDSVVTLAYVHATFGNFSSLSVMAIFNQADHLRGARGTQIGSPLLKGSI